VIEGELAAIVRRRLRGAAILDLVGAPAEAPRASRR